MRRLARFVRLEAWERRVLLRALVLLPLSMVRIRRLGVSRALRAAGPAMRLRLPPGASQGETANRIAALVQIAARQGPFRASCLPISVTLQRLLRERGIGAEVRLGVRKAGHRLEAHAWVEHDGRVLLDTGGGGEPFVAFERPIAPAARAAR
jgi:hypothetical protein